MTKTPSVTQTYQTLIKALFCAEPAELRQLLAPLSSLERQEIWLTYKKAFNALHQASHYSEKNSFQRHTEQVGPLNLVEYRSAHQNIKNLWSFAKEHLTELAQWLHQEKLNFFGSEDGYRYYVNIELLMAALADEETCQKLALMKDEERSPFWNLSYGQTQRSYVPETRFEAYILAWKDRATHLENWPKNCIAQAMEYHTPLGGQGECYASVQAITTDWPDLAQVFLGKAVYLELFNCELYAFTPAELVAGLAWLPPDDKVDLLHHFPIYAEAQDIIKHLKCVLNPDVTNAALKSLRSQLIDVVFTRLLLPLRRQDANSWTQIYHALELNTQEQTQRKSDYLRLLSSPTVSAIELALQIMLKDLKTYVTEPSLFIELGLLFSHPTQKIALMALRVWQASYKLNPNLAEHENTLAQAISSPHINLRTKVLLNSCGFHEANRSINLSSIGSERCLDTKLNKF